MFTANRPPRSTPAFKGPEPVRFSPRRPLRGVATVIVVLLAVVVAAVSSAVAAALTINAADLAVFSGPPPTIPDPVIGMDHFEPPPGGGGLDGQPGPGGNPWVVESGSWQYEGSSAVQVSNNSPNAWAAVDIGLSDNIYLEVEMHNMGQMPTANGTGIVFLADASSFLHVVYDYHDSRIEVRERDGGSILLATSANIGKHPTGVLGVAITQPDVKIYWDGSLVMTYQLSGALTTEYGSNTRFGMIAVQDKNTTFEYFLVENLP